MRQIGRLLATISLVDRVLFFIQWNFRASLVTFYSLSMSMQRSHKITIIVFMSHQRSALSGGAIIATIILDGSSVRLSRVAIACAWESYGGK
jgi:Cu/Ag efflux pump CusA